MTDDIQLIVVSSLAVESARHGPDVEVLKAAQSDLRDKVQAAVEAGASWQSIGDALGLRRGAAYQRYRRRQDP